jgi:hypothetical protein
VVIQPPANRTIRKPGFFEATHKPPAEKRLRRDIVHDVSRIIKNPCRRSLYGGHGFT